MVVVVAGWWCEREAVTATYRTRNTSTRLASCTASRPLAPNASGTPTRAAGHATLHAARPHCDEWMSRRTTACAQSEGGSGGLHDVRARLLGEERRLAAADGVAEHGWAENRHF